MQGIIKYEDKDGNKKDYYFHGMGYGESTADFLKRNKIEYKKIIECWTED